MLCSVSHDFPSHDFPSHDFPSHDFLSHDFPSHDSQKREGKKMTPKTERETTPALTDQGIRTASKLPWLEAGVHGAHAAPPLYLAAPPQAEQPLGHPQAPVPHAHPGVNIRRCCIALQSTTCPYLCADEGSGSSRLPSSQEERYCSSNVSSHRTQFCSTCFLPRGKHALVHLGAQGRQ